MPSDDRTLARMKGVVGEGVVQSETEDMAKVDRNKEMNWVEE